MDVVYRKTGFKGEFSRFLLYKYKIYKKRIKIPYIQHKFIALNTKSDAKIYIL